MITRFLVLVVFGFLSSAVLAVGDVQDGSNTVNDADFLLADNKRKDRRDDRGENRDDKQDCRQEEGRVGDDKRECKQENRGDGDEKDEGAESDA